MTRYIKYRLIHSTRNFADIQSRSICRLLSNLLDWIVNLYLMFELNFWNVILRFFSSSSTSYSVAGRKGQHNRYFFAQLDWYVFLWLSGDKRYATVRWHLITNNYYFKEREKAGLFILFTLETGRLFEDD